MASGAYLRTAEHRRRISEGVKAWRARQKVEPPKSQGVNPELRDRITRRRP